MVWLADGKKRSKICLFVLTECTNVTDTQTDTAWRLRRRLHSIARQEKTVVPRKALVATSEAWLHAVTSVQLLYHYDERTRPPVSTLRRTPGCRRRHPALCRRRRGVCRPRGLPRPADTILTRSRPGRPRRSSRRRRRPHPRGPPPSDEATPLGSSYHTCVLRPRPPATIYTLYEHGQA